MPSPYEQLNRSEREQIAIRQREGWSRRAIGRGLGRAASTISRELQRNGRAGGIYLAGWAQGRAEERRSRPRRGRLLADERMKQRVVGSLKKYWSPEQISGRQRREGKSSVSRTTIYRYIHEEQPELQEYLRSPGRKRSCYQRIRGQRMIEERPVEVMKRSRVGDWESDTLRGPMDSSACLMTHVERKTGYLLSGWLKHRDARTLNDATIAGMKELPVHTLTVDHGMEFARFKELEAALDAQVYFAHKKSPWERGLNENTNGLIRQFFPRGTDFTHLDPADVRRVQVLINNRPRKSLGYQTPKEAMQALGVAVGD